MSFSGSENPFNCNTRDCRVEHGNDSYLLDSSCTANLAEDEAVFQNGKRMALFVSLSVDAGYLQKEDGIKF